MAEIQQLPDPGIFLAELRTMDDSHLVAQDFVQQGAIHALSFLLANGCDEETAGQMLKSLRDNANAIRVEAQRRGKSELFSKDQTVFS